MKDQLSSMDDNFNLGIISQCRICSSSRLLHILDLGDFSSCGYFADSKSKLIPIGKLRLVVCSTCLLVQLDRDFNPISLFHQEYGYESSLNSGMKSHIENLATEAVKFFGSSNSIKVLEIGSNDGTLLNQLQIYNPALSIAVDPTISYFKNNYNNNIYTYAHLFDQEIQKTISRDFGVKFDLVFSVAMFYDLVKPNEFVNSIKKILDRKGLWIIEVNYLYSMLKSNAIDAICHEHLEYYSMTTIDFLLKRHQLKVVGYEENFVNGGSIRLYISHSNSLRNESDQFRSVVEQECKDPILISSSIRNMKERVDSIVLKIEALLTSLPDYIIYGLGASTKGNTFLQLYPTLAQKITAITEVNTRKFGKYTPGTKIKIISEKELLDDLKNEKIVFVVLPWHFKSNILERYRNILKNGMIKMIFCLPENEIYL